MRLLKIIAIPTPALPGSGSVGMISARISKAPHCEKVESKQKRTDSINSDKKEI
jgi:hypothetical protein